MGDDARYLEPDSGWLVDRPSGSPNPEPDPVPVEGVDGARTPRQGRPTARLSQGRISVPTSRRRVRSQDPGGASFDVAPHFAPDGVLLGGVAVYDDGREEQLSADQVEALFTPEEIDGARREAAELLRAAAGFGAPAEDLARAGGPMSYWRPPARSPAPLSGGWAPDFAGRDATESGSPDLGGYARRVGGKAARRAFDVAGPLALLGAGWLWGRARVAGAAAAPYTPGYRGAPTAVRRRRVDVMTAATIGAIILLICSMGSLGALIWQWHGLVPPGIGGRTTTGSVCCDAVTPGGGGGSGTPTATTGCAGGCNGSGGGGGGKGTPTATLAPGQPTPTAPALPDPHAPSATITFTRTTASATAPVTLVTCDGCADSAASGTTRGQKLAGGPTTQAAGAWGNNRVQTQGATQSVLSVVYVCTSSGHGFCSAGGGTVIADQSGRGNSCTTQSSVGADVGGSPGFVNCTVNPTGPVHSSDVNYLQEDAPCGAQPCTAQWGVASDVSIGSGAQFAYFTPNPCGGDGGAGARNNVALALGAGMGAGLGADAIGPQVSYSNNGYCANPANCGGWGAGQNVGGASTYTICASGSGWKLTFSPSGAQAVQKARVAPPAGYVVGGAIQVCGSVTIQSTDPANARATLACPASAPAHYDWTAAKQDTLRSQLAGKTVSEANAILAATAGVAAGSASVTLPSGGYTSLPTDPAKVTLTIT